jgi:ribosome-binding ATPase YchF (GTP1/OBG family)
VPDIQIIYDALKAKDIEWIQGACDDLEKNIETWSRKFKESFESSKKVLSFLKGDERLKINEISTKNKVQMKKMQMKKKIQEQRK